MLGEEHEEGRKKGERGVRKRRLEGKGDRREQGGREEVCSIGSVEVQTQSDECSFVYAFALASPSMADFVFVAT